MDSHEKFKKTTKKGKNISTKNIMVGKVTSAIYSPRLKKNIALAMVEIDHSDLGTPLKIDSPFGELHATVVKKPFFDPNKEITMSAE